MRFPLLLLGAVSACSLAGLDAYDEGDRDAASPADAVGHLDRSADAAREGSASGRDGGTHRDADAGPSMTPDAGVPRAPCDVNETPAAAGLFVSAAQGSDVSSGGITSPLKTLSAAMMLAKTNGATDVYVDEAVYDEVVEPLSALTLHGGWKATAALWQRDCSPNVAALTVIRGPSTTAVAVTGVSGTVQLEDFTIATSATAAPGASAILVLASGDMLTLTLIATSLVAAPGGAGASTATPAKPAAPGPCPGTPNSTGAAGSSGTAGAAASPGVFTASGYSGGDGTSGGPGGPGTRGTVGGDGESVGPCGSCNGMCSFVAGSGMTTAGTGQGGCGGLAGLAGVAGNGGGASVGVLLAGASAALRPSYSSVAAGVGGNGSSGSAGGPGGSGAPGVAGSNSFCADACFMNGVCEESGNTIQGGSAGGAGGVGGMGGPGGGGAGGPSYAVVVLGGASFTPGTGVVTTFGAGGSGAGGAPSGHAGSLLELP